MTVKEHYDNHLASFYSWMTGDFGECVKNAEKYFERNNLIPSNNKNAVDLGAGHGIYSIPLAKLGFKVTAVDFNKHLLDELDRNRGNLNIDLMQSDIFEYCKSMKRIELCLCMGDTLAHLDSMETIKEFLKNIGKGKERIEIYLR